MTFRLTSILCLFLYSGFAHAAADKSYAYPEMGISFRYPSDWRAYRSESARNHDDPHGVVVDRLEDPRANGGIVEAMIFVFTERQTHRSLAERAAKDVSPSNEKGLQFRTSSKPRTVGGVAALERRVESRTAGSDWRISSRRVYLSRDGLIYILSGMNQAVPPAEFERVFDGILQSFRFTGPFVDAKKPAVPGVAALRRLSSADRALLEGLSFYADSASHVLAVPKPDSGANAQAIFWGDGKVFRKLRTTGAGYQNGEWISLMFGEGRAAGTLKKDEAIAVLECGQKTLRLSPVTDPARVARFRAAAYYDWPAGRVPSYFARLAGSDQVLFIDRSRAPTDKPDDRLFLGRPLHLTQQTVIDQQFFRDGGSRIYRIAGATIHLPVKGGDRIEYADGRTVKLEPKLLDGSEDLSALLGPELTAANKPIREFSPCE